VLAAVNFSGTRVRPTRFPDQRAHWARPSWRGRLRPPRARTHNARATPHPLRLLSEGATFELLVLAASREGADPAFWTEEDPTEAAALDPPVAATPVKAVALEGVLSMQVLLEEGSSSGAEAAAEAAAGTEQG
jgi:hypothetical protein